MMLSTNTQGRFAALLAIVATAGLTGLSQAPGAAPPAIINETASMAKGVYVRVKDANALGHGDVVAMPMNPASRAYLGVKLGYPSETQLIKRVAGLPGDMVCRTGSTVTVASAEVHARATDGRGNPLASWSGCHRLQDGEVFLLGDHAASFDSRYFGPVPINALHGTYRAVLSW
jgi:conjugative transfer signal peptidase TraF